MMDAVYRDVNSHKKRRHAGPESILVGCACREGRPSQQQGRRGGTQELMSGGQIMRENTWFEARVNLMVGGERNPSLPFPCTRRWHTSGSRARSLCLPGLPGQGTEGQGRGRLISLFLSFLILGLFHPVGFTWTESNISWYKNEKAGWKWLHRAAAPSAAARQD